MNDCKTQTMCAAAAAFDAERKQLGFIGALKKFRREEDGAVMIMTLFIFLFMMVMAGIGIDTMRHEMNRAQLQATMDAAVLAGAGAPFGEDPKAIVEDYFDKAGMGQYLDAFEDGDIVTTLNSSKVSASASMSMDTYLMKLSGVETLHTAAAATAQTRVPKLEIALVLDVSNSMNNSGSNGVSKADNLVVAAKDFVTTIMNSTDPGNAVISIVPFSTSVAPSAEIYDALLVDEKHVYSNCLVFDEDDYTSTALVTDALAASTPDITEEEIKQAIYTSRYGNFDALNQSWRSCYTEDGFRIVPFSSSEAQLHTAIDGLLFDGNTTGSLGMKWGAAMLDPSFNDVSESLIDANVMDASLSTVPVAYSEGDTMKVIVMMGDGMNTTTYFFEDDSPYRGPDSDLFKMEYTDQQLDYAYYVYNSNVRRYGSSFEYLCDYWWWECVYEPSDVTKSAYFMRDPDSTWADGLETTASEDDLANADACESLEAALEAGSNNLQGYLSNGCDDVVDAVLDDYWYYNIDEGVWVNGTDFVEMDDTLDGFVNRQRLTWEQAWGMMSPDEYGDITGIYDAHNEYVNNGYVDGSTKNQRMDQVCGAAKTNGVVIYTIGYEISSGGTAEQSLKKCASGYSADTDSTPYYYPVDGLDITTAFSSIAGNVQSLRLTQ